MRNSEEHIPGGGKGRACGAVIGRSRSATYPPPAPSMALRKYSSSQYSKYQRRRNISMCFPVFLCSRNHCSCSIVSAHCSVNSIPPCPVRPYATIALRTPLSLRAFVGCLMMRPPLPYREFRFAFSCGCLFVWCVRCGRALRQRP